MITLDDPRASAEVEVEVIPSRVRAAIDALVAGGAIATISNEPRPVLVGHLQWLDDQRLKLFIAHGDAQADAHALSFDHALVNPPGSVTFVREGQVVGTFHTIDDADVEDPEDYRIAWALWQEVAPLRQEFIERCFQSLRVPRV